MPDFGAGEMLACPRDGRDADLLMDGEDEVAGCRLLSGGEIGSSGEAEEREGCGGIVLAGSVSDTRTVEVGASDALDCCKSSAVKALELLESEMALCVGDARCHRHGRGRRAPCRRWMPAGEDEGGSGLAGSRVAASLPSFWTALIIRSEPRRRWFRRLPAWEKTMEHHTGAPAVHRKSCTCNV
ncbi:hypothetical protein ACLOJK_007764 [Asimina triloba]